VTHAIIIGERCPYCTKFRSPLEILPMPGGAKICLSCEQRHNEALEALSTGVFTGRCSECDLPAEELRAQGRCGANGAMAMHFENGIYRAMCLVCDAAYVPKRIELYGGTEFGHELKLN
jgi:hypothetical protein